MKALIWGFVLVVVGTIIIASVPTPLPLILAILVSLPVAVGGLLIVFGFMYAMMNP